MKIAVNTRFLIPGQLEGYGYYIHELFRRITNLHPEHEFLFLFDRPYHPTFPWPPNVQGMVMGPPARHPLLWKYWYDFRVPMALKKWKADVFVSPDGFCSLHTQVPQVVVVHDLDYLHHPSFNRRSHIYYYRHVVPRSLAKASRIITVSRFSEKDILTQFPGMAQKTEVIYNGVREIFRPLDFDEKMRVKEELTNGQEYFLFAGAIHPRKNLVNLLKAFSQFKKRQRSGMKLVLAGRKAWMSDDFMKKLASYKYRDDVVVTGYLDEKKLGEVMGAAYALVYPSWLEGFGMPVAEAMQSAVPVITSRDSAMAEIAGEVALLVDPADPSSIAEQMMRIYKDETLRHALATKGPGRARAFDWDTAARRFFDVIEEATASKS